MKNNLWKQQRYINCFVFVDSWKWRVSNTVPFFGKLDIKMPAKPIMTVDLANGYFCF